MSTLEELFEQYGGRIHDGIVSIDSLVCKTQKGTPYLQYPGVVVLAQPSVSLIAMDNFLYGYQSGFENYTADSILSPGAQLCKTAGQLCYMSFGEKRTKNKDAERYFENLKSSGHGSVLEHANYSLLLYGVSRSTTHELVRHRAGMAYCLTGDTLIYSTKWDNGRLSGSKKRRLENLYAMTQTPHGRSRIKLLRLRCLDEKTNTFTVGCVKSVFCSGIKPVFKLVLSDGKTITSTKEHRFLTKDGWMPLEEIVDGLTVSKAGRAIYGKDDAEIMVNGNLAYKDSAWLYEQYIVKSLSQKEIADIAGVSHHTIRSWIRKCNLQKPMGSWCKEKPPANKGKHYQLPKRSETDRAQISERMKGEKNHRWKNGITPKGIELRKGLKEIRKVIYARDNYSCRLCRKKTNKLNVHHILPVWSRPDLVLDTENLVTICIECHQKKVNNHEEEYIELFGRKIEELSDIKRPVAKERKLIPKSTKILSITYAGEQMTYDIEMEGENHNFVANGIITHNSQQSQRYVSGKMLRFVERPEFAADPILHEIFLQRIDDVVYHHSNLVKSLERKQNDGSLPLLQGEAKTDQRKKIQQVARALLPNEVEAPLVMTGNARAWRHVLAMRASVHAETEIRALAVRIFLCLTQVEPLLFNDFQIEHLSDGTLAVQTAFPKI